MDLVLFLKVLLKLFPFVEMDNRGKGITKGISSTFQAWSIFVVEVLDSFGPSHWLHPCGLRDTHYGLRKMVHYLLYV